jgi:hypothetical protein
VTDLARGAAFAVAGAAVCCVAWPVSDLSHSVYLAEWQVAAAAGARGGEQITVAMTLGRDLRFRWWLWRSGADSF